MPRLGRADEKGGRADGHIIVLDFAIKMAGCVWELLQRLQRIGKGRLGVKK